MRRWQSLRYAATPGTSRPTPLPGVGGRSQGGGCGTQGPPRTEVTLPRHNITPPGCPPPLGTPTPCGCERPLGAPGGRGTRRPLSCGNSMGAQSRPRPASGFSPRCRPPAAGPGALPQDPRETSPRTRPEPMRTLDITGGGARQGMAFTPPSEVPPPKGGRPKQA